MTDELHRGGGPRDEAIAGALESIPVPEYQPGFWERLDAGLALEGFPGLDISTIDLDAPSTSDDLRADLPAEDLPVEEVPVGPPVWDLPAAARVVPLRPAAGADDEQLVPVVEPAARAAHAARSARRRGFALVGAAAAVIVAVVALQVANTPDADLIELAGEAPASPGVGSGSSGTSFAGAPGSADSDDGTGDATVTSRVDTGDRGDSETSAPATDAVPSNGTEPIEGSAEAATVLAAPIGEPGAVDTPQDTFVTWATALDEGDHEAALVLTGPRTLDHQEAADIDPDRAMSDWSTAYGSWATANDGRIDALEVAPSAGAEVVVLLLERPDERSPDGRRRSALPLVREDGGWLVEPAAGRTAELDAAGGAPPTTVKGAGPQKVGIDHVFEVPAAKAGNYTLALDRTATMRIPASQAEDGVIRWDPPDVVMTPGFHFLVVVHVTDTSITTKTTTVEVLAEAETGS